MITKSDIIERALLTLGVKQNYQYNNNQNRFKEIADKTFDRIIIELADNNSFAFNQRTILLNYYKDEVAENGEYKYNKPYDIRNIAFPTGLRSEGEFIYSPNAKQQISYNREIPLTEYPDYLFNYLRYQMCYELSMIYDEFRKRQQEFIDKMNNEERKINQNDVPLIRSMIKERMSKY